MGKGHIVTDHEGLPVMVELANVPDAGLTKVDPNAKSGNPRHDVRSGKFGGGGAANRPDAKKLGKTVGGQAVAQSERLQRYYDAVRDAARQFDTLDEGGVQDFLEGRVQDVSQVDLAQFLQKVQEQKITDVVDLFDALIQKKNGIIQSRRQIRLSAPSGFVKQALNAMSDDQVSQVLNRLLAREHTTEDLNGVVLPRIKDEDRRERLGSALEEV